MMNWMNKGVDAEVIESKTSRGGPKSRHYEILSYCRVSIPVFINFRRDGVYQQRLSTYTGGTQ